MTYPDKCINHNLHLNDFSQGEHIYVTTPDKENRALSQQ